jgi:hypothetical protein
MYCAICLKKVKETNKVLTNCKHTFHLSCILKNYKYNTDSGNKCPICRNYLFSTNPENHIINGSTFSPLRSVGAASLGAASLGAASLGAASLGAASLGAASLAAGPSLAIGSAVPRVYYWPPQPIRHNTVFYRQVFNRLKTKLYRNISERERKLEMLKYSHLIVNKLSYNELKEKLSLYGLSKRGYLRETFESKLMHYMITSEGLIV